MENLAAPFLAWQVYFDAYKKPPPWGERSHGRPGILEFYTEQLGLKENSSVEGFMHLLARKNQPKGHEICPCNSGKKLRNCHRELVYDIRKQVAWQDVVYDLMVLSQADITK